jgi:hypothetical protein
MTRAHAKSMRIQDALSKCLATAFVVIQHDAYIPEILTDPILNLAIEGID